MGQALAKLNEKFLSGEDRSSLQESKGMLHEATGDDVFLSNSQEAGDMLDTSPKTPPNVAKLKYDPRSPTSFERTPISIPNGSSD